ncbi:hypothetical protein, partial [Mycobacterium sp.]|uniref:hypothetical protein n=1 Tax=Mycobacterium sp. TaxID=1785 RepID=UPI003F9573FD
MRTLRPDHTPWTISSAAIRPGDHRALAVRRTGGEPSAVGIRWVARVARVARVAVSWPVRAQPHFHAGTADIPEYLGRCHSRSCNHELARGW